MAPAGDEGGARAADHRRRGEVEGRGGKLRAVLRQRLTADGPDPLAVLRERQADPSEPDFDWDREAAALEEFGYVFPLPIVTRLLSVARYVSAFGLSEALALGLGEWDGWERDFLFDGLVLVAEHERDARMIAQAALWRSLLSGRSSNG